MLSHGANSNISRGPRLSILYQLSSILSQPKWIVKNFLKKSGEIFSVLFYCCNSQAYHRACTCGEQHAHAAG